VVYTITVQTPFPVAPGPITNTARVTSEIGGEDPNEDNNQDTATTTIVLRPADGSSTMTDSSFKLETVLAPWTITDFEILVNNQGTIVATNPGQFYYHQRMTMIDTGTLTSSVDFEIDWPSDFMPQIAGGQPIHAYVRLDGSNTWTLWEGTNISGVCWSTGTTPVCPTTTGPHDGTITVKNVPSKAEVWITVHLDLRCKGMSYDTCMKSTGKDPMKTPYNFGPFTSKATQKVSGIPVADSTTATWLVGRGKKVTVVYGTLTDKVTGLAIKDTWVRISQTVGVTTNTATAYTGIDGFYVFYDGQGCADGLEGCTGASTATWTFGTGSNVSTTITILGTGGAQPLPGASPAYPKDADGDPYTSAEVRTGTNTWAIKNPPTYMAGVTKGTAYNRDWRFSGN
jgi:hypothetical protein